MKSIQTANNQTGWTIWGLVGMVALAGFFVLLFLKLFPPYMDNYRLKQALAKVAAQPNIVNTTRRDIIVRLDKILYLDYADKVVDLYKAVTVEKGKRTMKIAINYEVVVPMAYNISALLVFDNQVNIPLR